MKESPVYAHQVGIQLIDTLLARGKWIFTTQEAHSLAADLGIPPATVSWVLSELVRAGWLQRPRRGLYLVDETRRGGSTPHPFAIATALVQPSAISHWSAFAHHGLTEQIPRVITASTPKDIVTPRMRHKSGDHDGVASSWEVAGLTIRYIRVPQERFWGFDQVWVDEFHRVAITDRERTVLDGFVSPEVFGSLREVQSSLEEHLAEVDLHRLVTYAIRYKQGAAVKRLGYILERLGVEEEVYRSLKEFPIRGYRLLDPQGPEQGSFNTAWQIRDNLRANNEHF